MVEHLVPTSQLKTNRLAESTTKRTPLYIGYDKVFDALFIRIVPPGIETVTHYIDEHVALLYEADSLEIIGLQIEDFEYSFLPEHETVKRIWKLSNSGTKLENVGDMILEFERVKPRIAHEVVMATKDVLGAPGWALERAFA
jgi:hypothetical protein